MVALLHSLVDSGGPGLRLNDGSYVSQTAILLAIIHCNSPKMCVRVFDITYTNISNGQTATFVPKSEYQFVNSVILNGIAERL